MVPTGEMPRSVSLSCDRNLVDMVRNARTSALEGEGTAYSTATSSEASIHVYPGATSPSSLNSPSSSSDYTCWPLQVAPGTRVAVIGIFATFGGSVKKLKATAVKSAYIKVPPPPLTSPFCMLP